MASRRVDLRAILANPEQRRWLMIGAGVALQAREGIATSWGAMASAYDRVAKARRTGGEWQAPPPPHELFPPF